MATSGMVQKLNTQMNHEFYTSNLYLQLSEWCSQHNLNGTALFLRHQAQNTVTQMMRVFEYIKNTGATPVLQEQRAPHNDYATLEELFEHMMMDYHTRISALAQLAEEAHTDDDACALSFLNTFMKEEREDGTLLQMILDEVRNASKAGIGMQQTDKHLVGVIDLYH